MTRNTSAWIYSILFIALLFSGFGCTQKEKNLDREEAAKAITDSDNFKDCHTGMNNWDACNWNIYTGKWDTVASYWGSLGVAGPKGVLP